MHIAICYLAKRLPSLEEILELCGHRKLFPAAKQTPAASASEATLSLDRDLPEVRDGHLSTYSPSLTLLAFYARINRVARANDRFGENGNRVREAASRARSSAPQPATLPTFAIVSLIIKDTRSSEQAVHFRDEDIERLLGSAKRRECDARWYLGLYYA